MQRLGGLVLVLVLVLTVGGCAPSYSQQQASACQTSIQARAAGVYQDPAAEQQANDAYEETCMSVCIRDDVPAACLEGGLLSATDNMVRAAGSLRAACDEGNQPACDWVAVHPEAAAAASAESERVADENIREYEADKVVPRTVDQLAAKLYALTIRAGGEVAADQTVTLADRETIGVSMDAGTAYLLSCFAQAVTFRADIEHEELGRQAFGTDDSFLGFVTRQLVMGKASVDDWTTDIRLQLDPESAPGQVRCLVMTRP